MVENWTKMAFLRELALKGEVFLCLRSELF